MTDFGSLFETFEHRAFRFEALPAYAVEEEAAALEAFQKDALVPTDWHDEWIEFLSDCGRRGRTVSRVRLIPEPLTQYFEFEVRYGYRRSLDAGEDIRAIERAQLTSSTADLPDFWLFDDLAVCTIRYSALGAFEGVDVHEDPAIVHRYEGIATHLLDASKPISDYTLFAG